MCPRVATVAVRCHPGRAAPARRPVSGVTALGGRCPPCPWMCKLLRRGGCSRVALRASLPGAPGCCCRGPSGSGLPGVLRRWVRPGGLAAGWSVPAAVRARMPRAAGTQGARPYPSLLCLRPLQRPTVRFGRGVPPFACPGVRAARGGGEQAPALGVGACRGGPGRWLVPPFPARRSGFGPLGAGSSPWPLPTDSSATRVAFCAVRCRWWGQCGGAAERLGVPHVTMCSTYSRPPGACCLWALGAAVRVSGQWSMVSRSEGLHCHGHQCVSCHRYAPTWWYPNPRARGCCGPGYQGSRLSATCPVTQMAGGGSPSVGGPWPAGGGSLGRWSALGPQPPCSPSGI